MFEITKADHRHQFPITRQNTPQLIRELENIKKMVRTEARESLVETLEDLQSEVDNLGDTEAVYGAVDWAGFGRDLQEELEKITNQIISPVLEYEQNQWDFDQEGIDTRVKRSLDPWVTQNARSEAIGLRDKTRNGVRKALNYTEREELAYQSLDLFNEVVGLYPGYVTAVYNVLDNALEDLRPQQAIERARKKAQELAEVRVKRILETELTKGVSRTRQEFYETAFQDDLLDRFDVTKKWIAGSDSCPQCRNLDMREVQWNEAFEGDILFPGAHPACDCQFRVIS